MFKKTIAFVMVLLLSVSASSISFAHVDYSGIIESESNWVAGLQQPSGAIVVSKTNTFLWPPVTGATSYKIEPYFANLAVIGMLENPSAANILVAKNWINWYFNHLNQPDYNGINGSVYVYYANASTGVETSSGGYDSTDSYGTTFATMLKKYVEVSGDSTLLINNKAKIEMAVDGSIATLQTDGLTYSKPDYQIKFLMDNVEVNEGLASMAWLENNVLGDSTKGTYYSGKKSSNTTGIESLWNTGNNNYNSSAGQPSNWGVFYADATAQVFPIWTGVILPTSARAISLYGSLNSNYPGWPNLSTPDAFPWAILAYSGSVMEDSTRVNTFLTNIRESYITTGHPWPYYAMEAGFTIRAAKKIRDKDNLALSQSITASSSSGTAANANNGNLNDSWTGATTNNEWIQTNLGTSKTLNRLVIKWGATYATQYKIQVSDDGTTYTDAYTETAGNGGTDDILFSAVTKKYVKLLFTTKSAAGGVNLKEFELYNATAEVPINLALNRTATASSFPADVQKSVDGNLGTRWGSASLNNEWYQVDLGAAKTIDKVVVNWEAAYDTAYTIQTSTDNINFTSQFSTTIGDGGIDTITFSPTSARYVKILLTTRATGYGSSFWELEVYNTGGSGGTPPATPLVDPLSDWTKAYSHSTNMQLDSTSPTYFEGDTSRASRNNTSAGTIVYNKTGLTSFSAKIYEFGADLTKVKFYSSPNGTTWTLINSTHDALVATQSNWYRTNFTNTGTIPAGTNYLKVELSSTFAPYDTELSEITIN
ncbi:hypothetical protein PAECIP111891_04602 [Paenibacillus allorhizoplanae]|uniref:F5/8 type C domain-containing protein n=1 Tax=Paenibacillus allorhizoplanae TaxID=2905648 RepID=A0ABN8GV05_9BACL|nr:discoidin domain-containing protein [Paenibacillus allorhizoplanae]CAH1217611.1 hypothetical protein PAECIP111891_04602 [Paenibacillus allorhizoplanae]